MYVHTMPADSTTGYDVVCTVSLNWLSGAFEGMPTQLPSTSNFQPWWMHISAPPAGIP